MDAKGIENRRYERLFFSSNQRIEGTLSLPQNTAEVFKAAVLNLSEGGMHFTQLRKSKIDINNGDTLILHAINGPKPLQFNCKIEIIIRWVLDTEFLEHIGYGCEFINLPAGLKELIKGIVENGFTQDNY